MCETQDERGIKGISDGLVKRNTLPTITNCIGEACIDEFVQKMNCS